MPQTLVTLSPVPLVPGPHHAARRLQGQGRGYRMRHQGHRQVPQVADAAGDFQGLDRPLPFGLPIRGQARTQFTRQPLAEGRPLLTGIRQILPRLFGIEAEQFIRQCIGRAMGQVSQALTRRQKKGPRGSIACHWPVGRAADQDDPPPVLFLVPGGQGGMIGGSGWGLSRVQ